MGLTYCGEFKDKILNTKHEGYALRVRPDRTLTGSWTQKTAAFIGWIASCECGWMGSQRYEPSALGEDQALDEWENKHIQPMVNRYTREKAKKEQASKADKVKVNS